MTMRAPLLALMLVVCAAPASARDFSLLRKVTAFSVSIGCESWDVAETMFQMGIQEQRQRSGLPVSALEGNPILAGASRDPARFSWLKQGGVIPLHMAAEWLWVEDLPTDTPEAKKAKQRRRLWSQVTLYGNGALKCFIAGRNARFR
jgi:hypothetical protein